jgi:hypothetical protein
VARLAVFTFIVLAISVFWSSAPADSSAEPIVLENFESYEKGSLPKKGWNNRNGDPDQVYKVEVEADGNKFLKAKDKGQSIQVFKEVRWKLRTHPFVTWRWRAHEFPQGSDERIRVKNDSVAALYIVFPKRFFVPEAIKYVWSAIAPESTWISHRSNFPTLVIRSGKPKEGQWQTERRNVFEDFKLKFGRVPTDPVAIGFLTDANAVKGSAEADYDDVKAVSN